MKTGHTPSLYSATTGSSEITMLFNEAVISPKRAGVEAKFEFIHVLPSITGKRWGGQVEIRCRPGETGLLENCNSAKSIF